MKSMPLPEHNHISCSPCAVSSWFMQLFVNTLAPSQKNIDTRNSEDSTS